MLVPSNYTSELEAGSFKLLFGVSIAEQALQVRPPCDVDAPQASGSVALAWNEGSLLGQVTAIIEKQTVFLKLFENPMYLDFRTQYSSYLFMIDLKK